MFPREIVDLFVKEANAQNISLAPLLVVNQTFRLAARKAILYHVTLTIYASGPLSHNNRIKLFREILQEGDREILQSIKRLTIRIQVDGSSGDFPVFPSRADFITEVLTILAKAPTLQTLSICGKHPTGLSKLCLLSPAAIDALIAIRSAPSISELAISDLSLIPQPLLTGTSPNQDNLSVLRLLGGIQFILRDEVLDCPSEETIAPAECLSFKREDDNRFPLKLHTRESIEQLSTLPVYPWLQKLTRLDLFDGQKLWNVLSEAHHDIRFDALRTLEIGPASGNNIPNLGESILKILERAPAVEKLCSRHWIWDPDNPTLPLNNLRTFAQIRHLHIVHRYTRGRINQRIDDFLWSLGSSGPLLHIHDLTTSFEWPGFTLQLDDLKDLINMLDTKTWPRIQDILAKATPNLRKFGISFLFTKALIYSELPGDSGSEPVVKAPPTEEDILPVKNVMAKWAFRAGNIEFGYELLRDEDSGKAVCLLE